MTILIWIAISYSFILTIFLIVRIRKRTRLLSQMKDLQQEMKEYLDKLKRGSNEHEANSNKDI